MSSEAGSRARSRGGRFIGADPLRGLAALGVVVFHAGAIAGFGTPVFEHTWATSLHRLPVRFLESLNFGVFLFFALSGYLLGRPFLAAYIDEHQPPAVIPYLRNRALRLLPGLFAVFVLTLIVLGRLGTSVPRLAAVPLLVEIYFPSQFSTQGVIHFWTLDTEIVFYALLPVLAWLLARGSGLSRATGTPAGRRAIAFVAIAAVAIASLACAQKLAHGSIYRSYWFPNIAFAFTPGLALAVLSTAPPRALLDPRRGPRISLAIFVAAIVPFAYYVVSAEHPVVWARDLAAAAAAGLLVAGALFRQWSDGRCWRALDNPAMQWIGKRSYSLYLLHPLVILKLVAPLHKGGGANAFLLYTAIAIPLMVPITAISYELVEKPFLNRRRTWRPPVEPPAGEPEPAGERSLEAPADRAVAQPAHAEA